MSESESQEKSIDVTPTPSEATSNTSSNYTEEEKITPIRCFTGSAISGGLGVASYLLTKSIVVTYTTMPIKFNNPMAVRIASTVRTLIMGLTILATFLFGMVAIGLIALGIKLIIEEMKGKAEAQ